ncbi:receptor-type guanylate cyclase gcy-5-like [Nylanderia fulva]|uniref:receptor-type guanylate cyclase gcy-5-like n=1 Tax=Nylanderia fulva TaxID=613905 RepID=UPI0010FBBD79|nr:receptor-type guanylate cyclase gcy-5-like [Nylanderia fulva]XP_029161524.1 receptor-type guanylate cyclase gcy-5-like [Nylanderia fulva]
MLRPGSLVGLLVLVAMLKIAGSNRCLTTLEEVNPKRVIHHEGRFLNIQFEVSRRVTQRLTSEIMKIFLTEVMGYSDIGIIDKDDKFNASEVFERLSEKPTYNEHRIVPTTMVNMEVWIPPQQDTSPLLSKYNVKECGSIAPPGYFGWFVPEALARPDESWSVFSRLETASRYAVDEAYLSIIKNSTINPDTRDYYCHEIFCQHGMYVPDQCQSQGQQRTPKCAMLLAEYPDVTLFVKEHIDQMKLYVTVAWVGPNLRYLTKNLTREYMQFGWNSSASIENRSLVILHYSPSSVIPNEREFTMINFPRCGGGQKGSIGCAYESNRLTKLVWDRLELIAKIAFETISRAKFSREMYENLILRRTRIASNVSDEQIACDWLRENLNYTLTEWKPNSDNKNTLYVGGIFPIGGNSYMAKSIVIAAKMAKEVINLNNTLLRDYNLTLLANDGQCKSDMVMKSFIDYIVHNHYKRLVGVLGPACSETVEPLVGVSKHYKTVIISYSAEGSSFDDRNKYPYFFRTIGENRQYKYVYLQLLQSLGWHRVASLTEDGQKYTEYISYMQDMLRDNGIVFVANVKFPREREADVMTNYLQDLKEKRARIIIADVYDEVARQVMCQAYKLEMTAIQGYVWFLPLWLQQQWYDTDYYNQEGEKVPCTTNEMMKAINGHLGLSHAYFARDDDIMQEGITVREWRDRYEDICRKQNHQPSNYAGYAYDAMWTYAYATDRLIRENESYVFDLHSNHSVNRLTTIIGETDFNGVSGRIQFLGGPSRYSVINIVQFIDNETHIVGNFYPNASEARHEVIGGTLDLNTSAFVWLSETMPDDGSEPPPRCVLAGLAELLDVSCEVAIVVANIIGFSLLGAILIIGFVMIKRKYDEKVRQHEKYMKSLGIDLSQTDTSSLDVWEIPRDRVVINRKLGEGAFGTVYGGEAFFPDKGWLAVAVKTLKVGSSTDEKLDFLSEVEVMKRFEHKNIIKLLGVCIKCEPVLTVMEFMLYGDLKTYLLARRHLVNDGSYEDSDEISNKKLTAMALDVARALSYLAQLKYVHRDVASRNCLVNAQRVVKLGDFGMTRPMYENDYYKFNRKGMLPVRWMSPESLALGIFTPASDVWSYGVLLYEIVTFGSFPFQGMSNNEVLSHVKAGNCLTVPKKVRLQLESLMYSCWHVDHMKRPSAPEIVDFLATNPRIIAPCLDVPLSSVQLEHTAQLDIQLSENNRKFSISWPSQRSIAQTQESKSPNSPTPLLLDLNSGQDDDQTLDSLLIGISEQDSSSPLLDSTRASILKQMWLQENPNDSEAHRYVNLQPGMLKLTCEPGRNGSTGNIQMNERTSMLSEKKSTDNVSVL